MTAAFCIFTVVEKRDFLLRQRIDDKLPNFTLADFIKTKKVDLTEDKKKSAIKTL